MKAFWTYTLARIGVFAVTYGVVWLVASIFMDSTPVENLFVLLIALVGSSAISLFTLGRLRNNLASNIQERATRMTERIEESRRAEDVD
jgi:cytochrome c biogenesis factor